MMIAHLMKALIVSHFGGLLRLFALLWNHAVCSRLHLTHLTLIDLDVAQFSLDKGSSCRLFSRGTPICSSSVGDMLLAYRPLLQMSRLIVLTIGLIVARVTVHEQRVGMLITVSTHLLELRGSLVMASRLWLALLASLQHGDHFSAVVGLVALVLHFLQAGAMRVFLPAHGVWLLVDLYNLSLLLHGSVGSRVESSLHVGTDGTRVLKRVHPLVRLRTAKMWLGVVVGELLRILIGVCIMTSFREMWFQLWHALQR